MTVTVRAANVGLLGNVVDVEVAVRRKLVLTRPVADLKKVVVLAPASAGTEVAFRIGILTGAKEVVASLAAIVVGTIRVDVAVYVVVDDDKAAEDMGKVSPASLLPCPAFA